MTVLVSERRISDCGHYESFTLLSGKTQAVVILGPLEVRVCVVNASHRAWNGMGRGFPSVKEASEAYKSGEMKAILACVQALSEEKPCVDCGKKFSPVNPEVNCCIDCLNIGR